MSEHTYVDHTEVEFTLDWYREFLRQIRAEGHRFRTFPGSRTREGVLLRHDVDLSVRAALEMARTEADLDVSSTYLFLLASPLYNVFEAETRDRIRQIASLGHEVGLHFSTHVYWDKDAPPAESDLAARVDAERSALEELLAPDVTPTVSFHIPPDWVLDRHVPGVRSTYEPQFFTDIEYVADSGQRWREEPPDAREFAPAVQILTHPGLWGEEDSSFENRVQEATVESARHARDRAGREFITGVYS